MVEKEEKVCVKSDDESACCQVISLISVDERGQTVLPKEVRERMGIKPGDKLAVVLSEKGDDSCCLFLMRADELSDMVKGRLGPLVEDMVG